MSSPLKPHERKFPIKDERRVRKFCTISDMSVYQSVVITDEDCLQSAEILISTGQVISWKTKGGEELLFVSEKINWKHDQPIRGGIPICFPKFLNNGNIENPFKAAWRIDTSVPKHNDKASLNLILEPSPADLLNWPHKFEFRMKYQVAVVGYLLMAARIRNTDDKPFTFQFCYQNYLPASDISNIRIQGLDKLDYLDYQKNERFTEQDASISIDSEVDKVYINARGGMNRIVAIKTTVGQNYSVRGCASLPDIVMWNPWTEKAKTISDLGDGEYREMLCVGPAAVVDPVALNPGEEWTGRQSICIDD
ncbi:hypothetical protein ABFX02_11G049400 [Erythranthe guttata]